MTLEKDVIVDLTPPRIQLITGDRYINFGGSGLVIYQTSPDTVRSLLSKFAEVTIVLGSVETILSRSTFG